MNYLRVILIDDEADACAVLRLMLQSNKDVQIVAEVNDVVSGVAAIQIHQPDVIFLDVELGAQTGFDLLEQFPVPQFQVIFCTGFGQYAVRAIKKNALDYLVKPIDPDELAQAIEKAIKNKRSKAPQKVFFQDAGEVYFIEIDRICRIESDGAYTTIYLADGRKFVQARSLREYEEILSPPQFIRTHQSHLVNIDFVQKFVTDGLVLQMKNGNLIPVARRRKADALVAFGIRPS
jgi:two-component system, LytTR family, response regulator